MVYSWCHCFLNKPINSSSFLSYHFHFHHTGCCGKQKCHQLIQFQMQVQSNSIYCRDICQHTHLRVRRGHFISFLYECIHLTCLCRQATIAWECIVSFSIQETQEWDRWHLYKQMMCRIQLCMSLPPLHKYSHGFYRLLICWFLTCSSGIYKGCC